MGGPHRGGVFRHLNGTRAFFAAALCGALVSTAVMPAATGRSRADAATRKPVAPAAVAQTEPRLEKSFAASTAQVGDRVRIYYTITNTDDLGYKQNLSFVDTLPDGMVVASPIGTYWNCQSGAIWGNGGQVTLTGGIINAGVRSCQFAIDVTAVRPGTFTNDASNITAVGGMLRPTGSSTIVFNEGPLASLALTKWSDQNTFSAPGQRLDYWYRVTNDGNQPLTNVYVLDDIFDPSQVHCPTTSLAPGATMDCRSQYITAQADVDRGHIRNTALAIGWDAVEARYIGSPEASYNINGLVEPSMRIEKEADTDRVTGPGQDITYRYRVFNTGNVALSDVGVSDDLAGLPPVTCEETTLAPGGSTTCTSVYRTTRADADHGSVRNAATAHGTPPGASGPVVSTPASVTVAVEHGPDIALTKSADRDSFSAAGETITYRYHVTNTGNVDLNRVGIVDGLPGLSGISCEATTLAPDESTDCSATYRTTGDDVSRGSIHNVATALGTPVGAEEPITSAPSEVTVHGTAAKPALTIHKTVRPRTFSRVGQTLRYSYRVTNAGAVTLDHVRVEDELRGLSAVRCPKRTLAPSESMTCTATYRVRAGDLRAKAVRNRAIAQGTPPGTRVPVASRPAGAVAYAQVPVTG
ncbi:hypothetical protein AB0L06_10860 [Spirillospora sp. NPDC052269]